MLAQFLRTLCALEDWEAAVDLFDALPPRLRHQPGVIEHAAVALLHRARETGQGDRSRGLDLLCATRRASRGGLCVAPLSSWFHVEGWRALAHIDPGAAEAELGAAIVLCDAAFLDDPQDPYPGALAALLRAIRGDTASARERRRLAPVVRFAIQRLVARPGTPFEAYAATLINAVLDGRASAASGAADLARVVEHEAWQSGALAEHLDAFADVRPLETSAGWIHEIAQTLRQGPSV